MKKQQPSKYRSRIASHPLLYHLALIALVFAALALAAHFTMQLGTRHGARRTVPDFSGIPLAAAHELARQHDLELSVNDSLFVPAYDGGIVLDQLPEGGVEVKPGRKVYVTINSFKQKTVPVPYVAGRSLRQAKNMLEIAGLEIDELVYRPDIATNYVLEQSFEGRPVQPESRIEAEIGSGVTLYVGAEAGSNVTVVPLLVGHTLKEAKSRVWEAGLNVRKVQFDPGINLLNEKDARVYVQSPDPERTVHLGTQVDLRLTLDADKVRKSVEATEKLARALAEERMARERERADSLETAAGTIPPDDAPQSGPTDAAGDAPDRMEFFD